MNEIYAKLKRKRKDSLRLLLSDHALFEGVEKLIRSSYEYNPDTLLDDGEWYRIDSFKQREFYPNFLFENLNSPDIEKFGNTELNCVAHLLSAQGNFWCFQRVLPSTLLRKRVLTIGDSVKLEQPDNRILIGAIPDAIYRVAEDQLFFKDIARVNPIFPGLEELYREATDEQVEAFLKIDFVSEQTNAAELIDNVSKTNRKRILLALDSWNEMEQSQKSQLVQYLKSYQTENRNSDLKFDDNDKVIVSSDEDIKFVAFGIEERYYTTDIRSEKRLANSVVKL